jgi:hypothetical protein
VHPRRTITARLAQSQNTSPNRERSRSALSDRIAATLAIVALVVASMVGLAGTASAASGATPSAYAAQAEASGLTGSQATQLQKKVDGYLAASGGTQVSANKVAVPGGDYLLVVPGERYARDLTTTSRPLAAAACPYGYFCMYHGQNYTGGQLNLYHCVMNNIQGWSGFGSYINNQTWGTTAQLQALDYSVIALPIAYEANPRFNWSPVWRVTPCQ